MLQKLTFEPSVLIIPNISVNGGVEYDTAVKGTHIDEQGREVTEWETIKRVLDPAERAEAVNLARTIKRAIRNDTGSVETKFGLVCPTSNGDSIDPAEADIRRRVAEFNSRSRYSKLSFTPMFVEIASDDERAIAAMTQNMLEAMADLEKAMKAMDVKRTKDIINKLVGMDQLLPEGRGQAIKDLVKTVRKQANRFAKVCREKGEEVARAEAAIKSSVVSRARFAVFGSVADEEEPEQAEPETLAQETEAVEEAPEPITAPTHEPEVAEPQRTPEPAMAAESKSEDLVMVF